MASSRRPAARASSARLRTASKLLTDEASPGVGVDCGAAAAPTLTSAASTQIAAVQVMRDMSPGWGQRPRSIGSPAEGGYRPLTAFLILRHRLLRVDGTAERLERACELVMDV